MTRVLVVVENAMVERAIRDALRHAPDCEVMGAVTGGARFEQRAGSPAPDVVLIDDTGSADHVLDRIAEARETWSAAKTILLCTRMDGAWLSAAAAVGLDSAISKSLAPARLAAIFSGVVGGTVYHGFAPRARTASPAAARCPLTSRELEILRLVAAGRSNGDIAGCLFVTEQTVKFHLSNVYRKLGVSNRTEASHHAFVNGLVEFEPSPRPMDLRRAA